MVVTDIYDIEVQAASLEEAKDLAQWQDQSSWTKDDNAGSAELGDDHSMLVDGVWVSV
jgi:hypothetical protein